MDIKNLSDAVSKIVKTFIRAIDLNVRYDLHDNKFQTNVTIQQANHQQGLPINIKVNNPNRKNRKQRRQQARQQNQ